MKVGEARYFLAILPPEEVQSKVMEVKESFRDAFNSKAALRSPAHITLHMPFIWKERNESRLIDLLARANKTEKFTLQLNGYGAFAPRSIFIKNDFSQPLIDFQKALVAYTKRELNLFNATHNKGFHPHMTVAFRDLKKDQFELAWNEFENKGFQTQFDVDSFWLLKYDGKKWRGYKEFDF